MRLSAEVASISIEVNASGAARLPRGYRAAQETSLKKRSAWPRFQKFSRLRFPGRAIVTRSVAAAAGVAVLFGLVTEAAAKMSQKSVDYQDTPKNDQECSNCSLFQEPNSCTIVDGEISPKGWCKFWAKKAG